LENLKANLSHSNLDHALKMKNQYFEEGQSCNTSLTRSLNAETPRQPTAVYTMYDFFSFRRRHVSITNLRRVHNSQQIHQVFTM
jgi:hypothetical protein